MIDQEFFELSRTHTQICDKYYREWFKGFSAKDLVKHEQILSNLIDIDIVFDSLVIDDVVKMHELIRDECVRRLAMSCKGEA